jgi:hypothetical protein
MQICDPSPAVAESDHSIQQSEYRNDLAPMPNVDLGNLNDIDITWFNEQFIETDWLQMANDNYQGSFYS